MASSRTLIRAALAGSLLLLYTWTAAGQDRTQIRAHQTETELTVDGRLNEEAWSEVEPATNFRQLEPIQGESASQPTEVRVLYGQEAIYVGAHLYDENPSGILANLGRRDQFNRADWFIVSFDSNNNQETAYTFAVNAAGVQVDGLRTGDGGGPGPDIDTAWDGIWRSEVTRSSEGWVAELRIPYSQLRFPGNADRWRVHFRRRIPRLSEESEWPLVPQSERENILAQYGVVTNMDGAEARPNIQVRPYAMSRMNVEEHPTRPGDARYSRAADAGGDVKIGLSSNLTLDATVNPDFGQVEADPAQLNLSAFETFFDERRPFFLEGLEIYEFPLAGGGPGGGSNLLYTRRIGAQAPIVAATKLSGRTAGGTSFGLLGATTGENFSPTRTYGVLRGRQRFGEHSSAGAILTGFDGPAVSSGRKRALTGGLNWDLRFRDNLYGLQGVATFTDQRWTAQEETGRSDLGFRLEGAKRRGTVTYSFGTTVFGPDFDPNDLGRQRRNNYVSLGGDLTYQMNGGRPFGPFQQGFVGVFGGQRWSYQKGINQGFNFTTFSNWTLRSFRDLGLNIGGEYWFGGYDLFETRGLGPALQVPEYEVQFEYGTDQRRDWRAEIEPGLTLMDDGAREYEVEFEGEWTVSSRLSLRLETAAEWERGVRSWSSNDAFRTTADGGWEISTKEGGPDQLDPGDYQPFATDGRLDEIFAGLDPEPGTDAFYRPVYGNRNTREMDVTLRSNFALTPDLSLELYSQVFAARGQYENFQILADRDTYRRFAGYPKRDEFALQNFQLNSVLRWEFRPGSRLYFVWSQSRRADRELNPLAASSRSVYNQPLGEQLADTFGLFPNNTFLLKLEYTFLR